MDGHEVATFALLAAVALLLLAAYRTRVPYPILLVAGSALLAFVPGGAGGRRRPGRHPHRRAPAAALRRRLLHRPARVPPQPAPDRPAVGRPRRPHDGRDRRRRPLGGGPAVGRRVRPRGDRLAHGPGGGDGDRRTSRRPAALRHDRRGGVAGQRRDGPDRLQVRGRGRRHGDVLAGAGGRRVLPGRGGRHRDRPGRGTGDRGDPPPDRGRADGDHDLADDAVLRLPAGGGARGVRRARRRHVRHLPGLARARA